MHAELGVTDTERTFVGFVAAIDGHDVRSSDVAHVSGHLFVDSLEALYKTLSAWKPVGELISQLVRTITSLSQLF